MWLRQLGAPDAHVRHEAMNHLSASICHQGWICPATGYAVPYLIELLGESSVQDKEEILDLLTCIAEADPLHEPTWRHNPRVPAWEVPSTIPFKNAHAKMRTGIPLYLALLHDQQLKVRMQAAALLSVCGTQYQRIRTALLEALAWEHEVRVRANLVLALGKLTQAQAASPTSKDWQFFVEIIQTQEHELLVFCAALMLTALAREQTPQDVAELLAHVMAHPSKTAEVYQELPGGGGNYAWSAAYWALYGLGPARLLFVLPLLERMIRQADQYRASMLAEQLLFIVFGGKRQPEQLPTLRPATTLNDQQRHALHLLFDHEEVWRIGNFTNLLREYGLPGKRTEMADFLGRELPPSPQDSASQMSHRTFARREGPFDRRIAFLRERYSDLRIRQVQGKVRNATGREDDEFTVNHEIIFRFPKQEQAVEQMERERALLRYLQERVPLPVPNPVYASDQHEVELAFIGYRKLPGKPLYRELLESVDGEETVQHLAAQIASFLYALHHLPVAELASIDLPLFHQRARWEKWYSSIRANLFPHLPSKTYRRIEEQMTAFLDQDDNFAVPPVLIHGAFGPRTILYDARTRTISGVIDFRLASLGDPASDFAGLLGPDGYSRSFVQRLTVVYPALPAIFGRARFYADVHLLQNMLRSLEGNRQETFLQMMRLYPTSDAEEA